MMLIIEVEADAIEVVAIIYERIAKHYPVLSVK
jgi:hypothetical protein